LNYAGNDYYGVTPLVKAVPGSYAYTAKALAARPVFAAIPYAGEEKTFNSLLNYTTRILLEETAPLSAKIW
jgi:hypothetical protein